MEDFEKLKRRSRIFSIPANFIVRLVASAGNDVIYLPKIKDLPEDAIITGCMYNFDRDSFSIRVVHSLFEEVEEGFESPYFNECEFIEYKIGETI